MQLHITGDDVHFIPDNNVHGVELLNLASEIGEFRMFWEYFPGEDFVPDKEEILADADYLINGPPPPENDVDGYQSNDDGY